jgi:aminopeptidase N
MTLGLEANPRQQARMRDLGGRAAKMLQFYASLLGDFPYQSFTLALVESQIPGGHSPPYFAVLNQPLPTSPFAWRSDPVNFDDFPDFFLAHEIAHQWWGQAIGWKNYHEQWLSEGFAQYFAALYARHARGEQVFTGIMRQMRKTAADFSDQGPVYLGYRLGHLQGQGRIFRALVYNKGAVVVHMLRRLVGDDAFFRALRGFYERSRFTKVGTDDLRRAFEAATGRELTRFFERWIYGETLPQLTFSYEVSSSSKDENRDIVLRFAQGVEQFDVPVTVSLVYANGTTSDVVVAVQDAVTEVRVPLAGALRSVNVNADHAALAEIRKK